MSDVSRRELLRIGASLALGASGAEMISAQDANHVHQMAGDARAKGNYKPKCFTAHEYSTLRRLAEMIMPPDEHSKSALEAGAPEFIDLLASGSPELAAIFTGGMAWLAQVGPHSTYAADVLLPLLVEGIGIGLTMATAMNTATLGVKAGDAGVASAVVNTGQQIGGSIGTALLSTLAASAATSVIAHGPAAAAVHGYTTAFWWAAAIFAIGAVLCGLLLRGGVPEEAPAGELVMAH